MNVQELTYLINEKTSSYREYRLQYAQYVLEKPELFFPLLKIALDPIHETSIRAAWVIDFVLREKLELLYPHLNFFLKQLPTLKDDSAIRPMTKVCETLALTYDSKDNTAIIKHLNNIHINQIIEFGFDYMISDHKVAVKAYTMTTLFIFGKESDWVHDALYEILSKEISNESAAYKARGKKIIKAIDKFKTRKHL